MWEIKGSSIGSGLTSAAESGPSLASRVVSDADLGVRGDISGGADACDFLPLGRFV